MQYNPLRQGCCCRVAKLPSVEIWYGLYANHRSGLESCGRPQSKSKPLENPSDRPIRRTRHTHTSASRQEVTRSAALVPNTSNSYYGFKRIATPVRPRCSVCWRAIARSWPNYERSNAVARVREVFNCGAAFGTIPTYLPSS